MQISPCLQKLLPEPNYQLRRKEYSKKSFSSQNVDSDKQNIGFKKQNIFDFLACVHTRM